jgi:hypothetical protein
MNRRGEPCGAYALEGKRFCFWHDPDNQDAAQAARSAGGRARHGRDIGTTGGDDAEAGDLETVAGWAAILAQAGRDVLRLENSIARARALGYLAGQAVNVLQVAELEAQLEELRQTLEALKHEQGDH